MAEIASAFITIAPSMRGFGGAINAQAGASVRSSGKSLGAVFGKAFLLGGSVLAAAGIGSFLKDSIGEAREAQKVGAATTQIIKATGGAAKISASQVGDLATAISLKSGIDDEAIQTGANLLLTFKNVRNEVGKGADIFNRATQSAVDLSAAGFGSVDSASKMLGKALNDPVKGITALSRAGVTFTDQQKDQIKAMVESGDVLGAQKTILGEVESQVGGVAAATATSGEKAKVAFGNIKEQVGTALLPVIDTLERQFLRITPAIQKGIGNAGPLFQKARAYIAPFIKGIADAAISLGTQLAPTVKSVADLLVAFVGQMRSGTGAGGQLVSIFKGVASVLGIVFGFISSNQAVVGTFVGIILAAAAAAKVFAAAQLLVNIALAANPITVVVIAIAALAAGLVYAYKKSDTFRAIVDKAFAVVKTAASAVANFVSRYFPGAFSVLVTVVKTYITVYKTIAVTAFNIVKDTVKTVANFVVNSAQKYVAFQKKVGEVVGKVIDFFRKMPGKIKGFFSNLPGELSKIGGQIIDGLVRGIKAAAGKVEDAVKALVNKIPKKLRSVMGIASPSKVTTEIGRYIGEGLVVGMRQTEDAVAKQADKLGKKAKEKLDKLRDQLQSARSDFAGLVDPIASNFTQGLFDFDNAGAFTANLQTVKGTLTTLIGNFKTLIGEGLNAGFLYQLFQSAGPGLINSLAGLSKADAQATAGLFGDVTSLSQQLGTSVAGATDKGAALETQTARLEKAIDKLDKNDSKRNDRLVEALTQPAKRARRRAVLAA